MGTRIEWADEVWNPATGCTKVSPGCDHCYAETFAERFRGVPDHHFERGFDVVLRPERLAIPTRWRRPRRIFVNSMTDLFHASVPDEFIADVFGVMSSCATHTFQVLTKRHARMHALLNDRDFQQEISERARAWFHRPPSRGQNWPGTWPLPNVWLGVSAENQHWADIRIPALLDTTAAVRFLSCEPLLGPVDLSPWLGSDDDVSSWYRARPDWVIAGGESGHAARPMHPDWARSLRDQCTSTGVPFLLKQWGEWAPPWTTDLPRQAAVHHFDDGQLMIRAGKRRAGRDLDGQAWDQFPEAVSA
jgi:protein gp37